MYGRYIIYIVCTVGFVAFTVGCALATNINMLIGFRFVAGMLGVGPVTIGGGTIADLMAPEARGRAMAIWAMGREFCAFARCAKTRRLIPLKQRF